MAGVHSCRHSTQYLRSADRSGRTISPEVYNSSSEEEDRLLTNAQERRLGRALKAAFIVSVIAFLSGIFIGILEIGSQHPWPELFYATLFYLPPIVLVLGGLCLAILSPTRGIRAFAIAPLLLLPLAALCLYLLKPRSGQSETLGWSLVFGFLGSAIAAWTCGMVAASRAAAGRPYPGYPACQKCGYNLTGNVSGVCPECGQGTGELKRLRFASQQPKRRRCRRTPEAMAPLLRGSPRRSVASFRNLVLANSRASRLPAIMPPVLPLD
jgi:hypothetical protein